MDQIDSSYHPLNSRWVWTDSSSTPLFHSLSASLISTARENTPQRPASNLPSITNSVALRPSQNVTTSSAISSNLQRDTEIPSTRFNASLVAQPSRVSRPRPYQTDLQPLPSTLRPHCLARERLQKWSPLSGRSRHGDHAFIISDEDLERVLIVLNASWQQGTRETYGAGLLVFHVFCDQRNIPERQRCPASSILMLTFVSSCAGSYSGSALANYFYGIKAWHTLHGQTWSMDNDQMKAALDGAKALAPPSSRRPKRAPITVNFIIAARNHLDLNSPLDAAFYACLTTTYFGMARVGK